MDSMIQAVLQATFVSKCVLALLLCIALDKKFEELFYAHYNTNASFVPVVQSYSKFVLV